MDNAIKYRIVVWVVVIFLLIFLPSAVIRDSQAQTEGLVSGLGVDASPEGLEVSVQLLIPQPSTGYAPRTIISSAESSSILDCIRSIELKIGQRLGLAHCYVVIVGDEICDRNLAEVLDFLVRSNIMGNNTALFHTEGTAKELLEVTSQLSAGDVNNLQNLTKYDKENYAAASLSLIDFYKQYLSPASCSAINTVGINQAAMEKGQFGGGGGGSEEESSSGASDSAGLGYSASENVLDDRGKVAIFKKGVRVEILEKEDVEKISRLDPTSQRTFIDLENFTDQKLNNAKISMVQTGKNLSFNPKLVNGIPVLEVNTTLITRIESIENDDGFIYTSHSNYYTPAFVETVRNKVKQDIADAIAKMKEGNYDIIDVYSLFNISNSVGWKQFLATLENTEDYLQWLEVYVNVSVINRE